MKKYCIIFVIFSFIHYGYAVVCSLPYKFSYRDSCYYLGYNPDLTFNEARIQCIMDGGHLVIFETKDEETFIGNYLQKIHLGIRFYLDATDFQQEGYYYWEHTGRNLTYTNWNTNEPRGGMNENCVWKFGVNLHYKWIDISCFEPAAYLCEKEGN